MFRYIEDLAAPREWFKANVKAIVKEYAPQHPIQKEDIILGARPCLALLSIIELTLNLFR